MNIIAIICKDESVYNDFRNLICDHNLDLVWVSNPLEARGHQWHGYIVLQSVEQQDEIIRNVKLRIYSYEHLSQPELITNEAIVAARTVQNYIWGNLQPIQIDGLDLWVDLFQKRVDRIKAINMCNEHAKVELRKRLLQQAALSIAALQLLDKQEL